MDGTSTNWKVLKLLEENHNDKYAPSINIVSCGFHTVLGAFQTGTETTTSNLRKLMKATWQTFYDFSCKTRCVYQNK